MTTLQAWLTLRSVKGLGDEGVNRLVQIFGSPEAVCGASQQGLQEKGCIKKSVAEAIARAPDPQAAVHIQEEMRGVEAGQYIIVSVGDQTYPQRLSMISTPPSLLYMTGKLLEEDTNALAVVGARKASLGGVSFTEELSYNLASLGFTIVSGMARGIDAAAHRGALKASGRTIAVLGCGIDQTYPPEHKSLRRDIEERGVVISEFPTRTPPRGHHFPRRNRIISGLSVGVIVTEAALQSGSLITGKFALEQNREVFAVPGSVKGNRNRGPHHLIKQGAKLVEGPEDILEEVFPQLTSEMQDRLQQARPPTLVTPPQLTGEEGTVFQLLSDEPLSGDEVTTQARFHPAEVMSILLSLELKGLIKQLPGPHYIRSSAYLWE
ncbi:MAG: DNA-processing protein DprA [Nitrospirae bacterium]|nr:DNA-processing protein DprA [Nitrospirota bacterium]